MFTIVLILSFKVLGPIIHPEQALLVLKVAYFLGCGNHLSTLFVRNRQVRRNSLSISCCIFFADVCCSLHSHSLASIGRAGMVGSGKKHTRAKASQVFYVVDEYKTVNTFL